MAWIGDTKTVSTIATLVLASNINQKRRELKNIGSEVIYIGSTASVTISNGFPLRPQETIVISDYNGDIYGIIETTDTLINIFEDE